MLAVLPLLVACGQREAATNTNYGSEHVDFSHAKGIELITHPSGWIEVNIRNPWDTTRLLQKLALVKRGDTITADIPGGIVMLTVPLEKILVQSTVHVGLFEEIHAAEAIAGVSDAAFIRSEAIKEAIREGKVKDCGSWMSPDLEQIIALDPEAVFISPYEKGGTYGHLTELGIPLVYVADYMESDPLGRAEWIKYYGLLLGREGTADSLFSSIENLYNALSSQADSLMMLKGAKSVLMDLPFQGSWYVPGEGTSNDWLIRAAGGENPMASMARGKIIPASNEQVIARGIDSDTWIIRLNDERDITMRNIVADYPFVSHFKAYADSNIWVCNTNKTDYYEEAPFHPERVLDDLVKILYYAGREDSLRYFHRIR